MASVQAMPTRRPACLSSLAIMRTVVVLPLVPVTDSSGIRGAIPAGYMLPTTVPAATVFSATDNEQPTWRFPVVHVRRPRPGP